MGVVARTGPLAVLGAAAVLMAAGCGGGGGGGNETSGTTTSSSAGSNTTVALVSDIGKFNDRSFNQSQKEGLDRAKADLGVNTIAQVKSGKFKPKTDLLFNLKNGGMAVGQINPRVPTAYKNLMKAYKARIISGKLKVPAAL